MKKILIALFFVSLAQLSWSQVLPIDEKTNKVTFIEKVEASGMDVSQLQKAVKDYMKTKAYTVTEEVEGSKIVYKAYYKVTHPKKSDGFEDGKVHFSYSLFFKEGRYRIIMTDFVHEGDGKVPDGGALESVSAECGSTKMTAKAWVTIKKRARSMSEQEIADLKQFVLEIQNDPANDDDW